MTPCTFPHCPTPASTLNRAAQHVCQRHERVVMGTSVDDGRHDDRTEGQ